MKSRRFVRGWGFPYRRDGASAFYALPWDPTPSERAVLVMRQLDGVSSTQPIVDRSTTAADSVDEMETGWTKPHARGTGSTTETENTTLPRCRETRALWSNGRAARAAHER